MEAYATQDTPFNKELGTAYDAPFWYQPDNGLTSRQQAAQVKQYYRRAMLPPWNPPPPATQTAADRHHTQHGPMT